ncbi:MAG: DNA-processing protein DprA [Bifidobacteriaceae bacterium]|nr:DNA-processing protein DprA [Bifidobacteriaceae bacterium]
MNGPVLFETADPLLARAAWSRIAEPGDRDAGVLVGRLGPVAALEWLLAVADRAPGGVRFKVDGEVRGEGRAAIVRGGVERGLAVGSKAAPGAGEGVRRAVARWVARLENLDPRRELRVLRDLGGRLIVPEDPDWPDGLRELGDSAPLALWAIGVESALTDLAGFVTPSVAVVGSRASTRYGEAVTAQMVAGLVGQGFGIVSGGAFGIDAAAHRAALGCGGRTAAVMAGGVDRLYPKGNTSLLREIVRVGVVLSEVPPGSAPRRERFLARNRLIAAMTTTTVVVEAGWRSGARNTASHAAGLVRPVGAVPGPVTSAASAGCHRLIRDGIATCVTDCDDVIELIGPIRLDLGAGPGPQRLLDDFKPAERVVLDCLPARSVASVESVAAAAGQPVRTVLAALGALERRGAAHRAGSGWARGSGSAG